MNWKEKKGFLSLEKKDGYGQRLERKREREPSSDLHIYFLRLMRPTLRPHRAPLYNRIISLEKSRTMSFLPSPSLRTVNNWNTHSSWWHRRVEDLLANGFLFDFLRDPLSKNISKVNKSFQSVMSKYPPRRRRGAVYLESLIYSYVTLKSNSIQKTITSAECVGIAVDRVQWRHSSSDKYRNECQ